MVPLGSIIDACVRGCDAEVGAHVGHELVEEIEVEEVVAGAGLVEADGFHGSGEAGLAVQRVRDEEVD